MCLAVPGKIVSVHGEGVERRGVVAFGEITKEVSLALLSCEEAREGRFVIVHVGFALSVLDEEEAVKTLERFGQFDGECVEY